MKYVVVAQLQLWCRYYSEPPHCPAHCVCWTQEQPWPLCSLSFQGIPPFLVPGQNPFLFFRFKKFWHLQTLRKRLKRADRLHPVEFCQLSPKLNPHRPFPIIFIYLISNFSCLFVSTTPVCQTLLVLRVSFTLKCSDLLTFDQNVFMMWSGRRSDQKIWSDK